MTKLALTDMPIGNIVITPGFIELDEEGRLIVEEYNVREEEYKEMGEMCNPYGES